MDADKDGFSRMTQGTAVVTHDLEVSLADLRARLSRRIRIICVYPSFIRVHPRVLNEW